MDSCCLFLETVFLFYFEDTLFGYLGTFESFLKNESKNQRVTLVTFAHTHLRHQTPTKTPEPELDFDFIYTNTDLCSVRVQTEFLMDRNHA